MTAWIPNVVPDEPIESAWGNLIRDRTVTPFANAAARTTAIPAPAVGMATWQIDTKRIEVYDGTYWIPATPYISTFPFSVEPLTGSYQTAGEVSFGTPSYPYRMLIECTWFSWHAAGSSTAVNVTDMAGVAISAMDGWVYSGTTNTTFVGASSYVTPVRTAAASVRVRAVSNGGGGIRGGLCKVTFLPSGGAQARPGSPTDGPTVEPHNETENE